MFQVVIRSHFDAAHFLRNYQGKCARLHGHRWDVEVCIEGQQLDELGMLVDFGQIKQGVNGILDRLDHELLNEIGEFAEKLNPTAENLAQFIYHEIKKTLGITPKRLAWVKVYESGDAWAVYKED